MNKTERLKLMDLVMANMNDEEIWETWIQFGIPDGSNEKDFIDYVEDYNDFEKTFKNLLDLAVQGAKEAQEPVLVDCPKEAFEFAKTYNNEVSNITTAEVLKQLKS